MNTSTVRTTDGTDLSVRICGMSDGPTMLLCDGIGCDGFIWRYVRREFEKTFRVVHFHYRGHGLSMTPPDTRSLSIEQFAADAWFVLDTLGIDKAVLWGHSMGVQVILEAAWQQPERVLALLPMCGAFEKPLLSFRDSGAAAKVVPVVSQLVFGRPDAVRDVWRSIVPTDLAYWFAIATELNFRMIQREDFDPYLEHLARMDPVIFLQLLEKVADHSTRGYLRHIEAPVLVFAGSRDNWTPARLSRELADTLPNGRLCVIPGGSHTAPIELPDLVTLRAERFFRREGLMA